MLINLFIRSTASLRCSSTALNPLGRKKLGNQGSSQTSDRRHGAQIGRSFFPLAAIAQHGREALAIKRRKNILSAIKNKKKSASAWYSQRNLLFYDGEDFAVSKAGNVELFVASLRIFSVCRLCASLKLHQVVRQSRSLQLHAAE